MLSRIDALMDYIETGNRKGVLSIEEALQEEVKESRQSVADLMEELHDIKETLKIYQKKKADMDNLVASFEKEMMADTDYINGLLDDAAAKLGTEGMTVKRLASVIGDTNGKVYVEFDGALYGVDGIYCSGARRIIKTTEVAYQLDEKVNKVTKMTQKNINTERVIREYMDSVYKLHKLTGRGYYF